MTDNQRVINRIINSGKAIINTDDFRHEDETEEFINSIRIAATESKTLIPVVCEDMFEYEDPATKERQTLHSFLVEQVFEQSKHPFGLTLTELSDIVNEGYYGMRLLENKSFHNLIGDKPLYKLLYSSVMQNQQVASNIHLKKEVKAFLEACNFPLIVTTSCFGIIEKDLGYTYQSKYASLSTKNEEILPSKCVYHIFGEASFSHPNWGYSDMQILEYLRSALGDRPWSNLTSSIKGKSLLILGNDSPDWLFRFILTPIFGSSVYDKHDGYYVSSGIREEDRHLVYFLSDITFTNNTKTEVVLNEITKAVNKANHHEDGMEKRIKIADNRNHIFIAHASEDNNLVIKLSDYLEMHGLRVYTDFKIEDGNYWAEIVEELKKSAYFLPFVTYNYLIKAKKYEENNERIAIFEELGIDDPAELILNSKQEKQLDQIYKLSKRTNGVATELILAEQILKLFPKKVYSIPTISSGQTGLTAELIEQWADAGWMPRSLFSSKQMRKFYDGKPDPFEGKFDYERYKYEINE